MSTKEEKRRLTLQKEREALTTEAEKDEHLVTYIKDIFWNYESLKRASRLVKAGKLRYVCKPGFCGYFEEIKW